MKLMLSQLSTKLELKLKLKLSLATFNLGGVGRGEGPCSNRFFLENVSRYLNSSSV